MLFKKYMTMINNVHDQPQPLSTLSGSVIIKSPELEFCPWPLHLIVAWSQAENSIPTPQLFIGQMDGNCAYIIMWL